MAQMTVRNIDDGCMKRLKERARLNKRSLEAEVRDILEKVAQPGREEFFDWTREFRNRLRHRYTGDPTAEIRMDRDSH